MLRLCVAGATGRMGVAIIQEARAKGILTVGAVEAPGSPVIGKTLRERGISDQDTCIVSSNEIGQALKDADVYISFTSPVAEMQNIPTVVKAGKRVVLGTTGFTPEQNSQIRSLLGKVPAVFSPNYSVGVNILFKLAEVLKAFPEGYDCSISEIHHTAKKDAPSGTALKLGEIVSEVRGYTANVYGREGVSVRKPEELEIVAMRAGGVPGIHDLIVAGPYEMLRIEHTTFSRNALAQGAVVAAEWVSKQETPGVYNMATVLGL